MHMGTSILLRSNLSHYLPHSNPFGAIPWLPSDRFLLSSSRCTGVYGSGADGDSRADLYSDPLSPCSIWSYLLAIAAIQ
ncbi:unnamed protein product [Prunus armeniaca]|uniref:Uncharacterized protein n=1 Tax=Prunus armeniaca TaxID=36596 RepID=A0A6J5Y1K7_PRUAR|nr:unnamed protein product [Prunus armeniaca]